MRFKVTQAHIDTGVRCSPTQCPVARCFEETLGIPSHELSVGTVFAAIKCGGYSLPDIVRNNIRKFDSFQKIEPFEFDLDIKPKDCDAPIDHAI